MNVSQGCHKDREFHKKNYHKPLKICDLKLPSMTFEVIHHFLKNLCPHKVTIHRFFCIKIS